MDISWSPEQTEQYEASVAFAREHLDIDLAARDAVGEFRLELWHKAAEHGVLGWCMPEAYGGAGLDVVTTIRRLEGIGYGCRDNALTLGLNGQLWSVQEPLLHFGSDEQKERYLPRLIRGELCAAHGMTEPTSGSDAFSLQTTAEKVDGGYLLTGHKTLIGLAPIAGPRPGVRQYSTRGRPVGRVGVPGRERLRGLLGVARQDQDGPAHQPAR